MICLRNTELAWTGKIDNNVWYPPESKVRSFRNLDFFKFLQDCNKDRYYTEMRVYDKDTRGNILN